MPPPLPLLLRIEGAPLPHGRRRRRLRYVGWRFAASLLHAGTLLRPVVYAALQGGRARCRRPCTGQRRAPTTTHIVAWIAPLDLGLGYAFFGATAAAVPEGTSVSFALSDVSAHDVLRLVLANMFGGQRVVTWPASPQLTYTAVLSAHCVGR